MVAVGKHPTAISVKLVLLSSFNLSYKVGAVE
jgi:hypothetical protein